MSVQARLFVDRGIALFSSVMLLILLVGQVSRGIPGMVSSANICSIFLYCFFDQQIQVHLL